MRVKKPTSKRGTTRMREGIKKKAAAQRRKDKKFAKKDVTWKSRANKDPGIPASFPYKEQIIEELEHTRQLEVARREELRQQKQQEREAELARAGAAGADAMETDGPSYLDSEDGAQGSLAALMASAQQAAREYGDSGQTAYDDADAAESDDDVEIELEGAEIVRGDVDKSRRAYDKIFKAVVDAADVVLYVLDARDPESTRSRKVEQAVLQAGGKRLIFVLNKVDLVPAEVLAQWLDFLKSSFPTVPVKASAGAVGSSHYNKNLSHAATAGALLHALKTYAAKQNLKRSLVAGVIGYPNVGKSSIINALTGRHGHAKACPVGNLAGVTTAMREVKVDNKLKILDSPGIVFPDEIAGRKKATEAQLALLSAVAPKHIQDPAGAVQLLLKRLSKDPAMADAAKAYYSIPPLPSMDLADFTKQFLIHVARARGRLTRGGIPNMDAAATTVLNDWRDGRITGWVLPNSSRDANATADADADAPKSALRGEKEPAKVEATTVVSEWAKEFDLDGLLGDNFGLSA